MSNGTTQLRRKISVSIMATIGFLLSPLSWWNDLYVNIPIAYALAWLVSIIDKRLFDAAMVFFYWLTNLAGLLLLHKGAAAVIKEEDEVAGLKKRVLLDVALSIAYSAILAVLIFGGIIRHPEDYFKLAR